MYSGVFAIALLLGPQQPSHAKAKPTTTQSQSNGHDGNRPPNESQSPCPVNELAATSNTNTYQGHAINQPIPWWDHNWVGFLIAGFTLAVNGFGLRFIYMQVKANVESTRGAIISAEAASRQTELLILANRPWLIVKPMFNGISYTFTAHNTGKSPAIIVWRDPFIPARDVPIDSSLPPQPTYGYGFAEGGRLVHPIWVAPGATEDIGVFDSFAAFPDNARLMVFSAIKYRNIYDERVHESRFCYRISGGSIALDGPRGYNEYT